MSSMLRLGVAVLVIAGAAVFWFRGEQPSAPPSAGFPSPEQPSAPAPRGPAGPESVAVPEPAAQPPQSKDESQLPAVLNEQTLANTTWGRDGFELELAPAGVLRIGGRERANWQVIGNRVRLYDQRGEEHWLDIENGRLTWNGEEVGRIR